MQYNEQQAFEIELRKELDKFFPDEFIYTNFHLAAARALQYQSLPSLKVGIDTYEKMLLFVNGTIDKLTFYEISFLINAIGSATPNQLIKYDEYGLSTDVDFDYVKIQRDNANLSIKWNSLVDPIKESLRRKVNAHLIRGLNPSNGKRIIH